jgi:hypothetical protein
MCQDCVRLHAKLQELNGELFHVKRSLTKSRQETKRANRDKQKILKKYNHIKDKQHYKNGKRGTRFNG